VWRSTASVGFGTEDAPSRPRPEVLLIPYRLVAEEALARWRAAHARIETIPQDSPEWQAAYIEEELAKLDYQDAVEAARRAHLPEPPPFPEEDGSAGPALDPVPST
jgi:hypothetical protein